MGAADKIAVFASIAAWISAIATLVYLYFVYKTLKEIQKQWDVQHRDHRLDAALVIFTELETQQLVEVRRYIYENVPENIDGLNVKQLKEYVFKVEIALVPFDRIGYLVVNGYIDEKITLENYWFSIWRCWKKCQNLICWARVQRNEPQYFGKLEELFHRSEAYRIKHLYDEPTFYPSTKIALS